MLVFGGVRFFKTKLSLSRHCGDWDLGWKALPVFVEKNQEFPNCPSDVSAFISGFATAVHWNSYLSHISIRHSKFGDVSVCWGPHWFGLSKKPEFWRSTFEELLMKQIRPPRSYTYPDITVDFIERWIKMVVSWMIVSFHLFGEDFQPFWGIVEKSARSNHQGIPVMNDYSKRTRRFFFLTVPWLF